MGTAVSPLISAVVATYNEERHIEACLSGLCAQVDLPGDLEIIVVDGNSTDRTLEIVRALAATDARIRVVPNPNRYQVYAWNIGTQEARGPYVAFFSAHTEYAPDYLARCYEAHHRTGAANVGGVQVPIGEGFIGRAVALAMQSPFGIGNAQFRYAQQERFVDTVFGSFFDRSLLIQLGGYDETIPFNEDSEFNYRLRKAGYTIFMSPKIRVRYHVRSSLGALSAQMYRYGYWRRRTQLEHPDFVPWRVMAPPLLLLLLIVSLAAYALTRQPLALAIPALYALFVALGTVSCALKALSLVQALPLPVVLPVMHLSYGAGWWAGLLAHRRRGSKRGLARPSLA
jgi:succinoglycan biosynthesis protein ExoA